MTYESLLFTTNEIVMNHSTINIEWMKIQIEIQLTSALITIQYLHEFQWNLKWMQQSWISRSKWWKFTMFQKWKYRVLTDNEFGIKKMKFRILYAWLEWRWIADSNLDFDFHEFQFIFTHHLQTVSKWPNFLKYHSIYNKMNPILIKKTYSTEWDEKSDFQFQEKSARSSHIRYS